MAKDTEKLIRQLSLISYLMAERRPVTALEIRRDVEGYSGMNEDAFARRFYADRAELESLGIQLTVDRPADGAAEQENYSLRPENFHLPAIEFTDEELASLQFALSLLDGEFAYAEPLRLALQQITWGRPSPLDAPDQTTVALGITASAGGQELSQRLAKVETAIFRHKTITFEYHSIERDDVSARKVDPYHLLYRGGQFYLLGYSHEREALRVFRLSRMRGKVAYVFRDPVSFETHAFTAADYRVLVGLNGERTLGEVFDVSRYSEGFRAFGYVVGVRSPRFWIALRNTLQFVLMAVPLSVIPALVLATVLNSKLPGMAIFRAIYFIPSIAAIVGISLVWRWMYDSTIGWINYFVTLATSAVGWNDPRIQWLNLPSTALLAVVIMSAWQTTGFNSVLFLAGLQNVPGELYEAATVDGAGTIAKFFRITLPLLAPTTFFVVSTTIIQALQVFEQVYILTNPPGAPADSTLTLVLYLYQEGFNLFDFGFASAVAWILFAVIFAFTLVQFQRNRQSSVYES